MKNGETLHATADQKNRIESMRAQVRSNRLWYHTMDLAPGVTTPGWFDLRPIVSALPWPDVKGKRCLDVGTYDGFLAFELERRGASEIIATDITDHAEWDWPVRMRQTGPARLSEIAGEKGLGFRIAKDVLGSKVVREKINVYDLTPERLGAFDVVVCGALMLHLRDPLRALEQIRSVCEGSFLSLEEIRVGLRPDQAPRAELDGISDLCQWWVPNVAGHHRMLMAAGFDIVHSHGPYAMPFGPAHPSRPKNLGALKRRWVHRLVTGGTGAPYSAVLTSTAA